MWEWDRFSLEPLIWGAKSPSDPLGNGSRRRKKEEEKFSPTSKAPLTILEKAKSLLLLYVCICTIKSKSLWPTGCIEKTFTLLVNIYNLVHGKGISPTIIAISRRFRKGNAKTLFFGRDCIRTWDKSLHVTKVGFHAFRNPEEESTFLQLMVCFHLDI